MTRREVLIRGVVQGVGFRPFVVRLATRLGLTGFVRNEGGEVRIEVEGDAASLDRFMHDLRNQAPRHARIDAWQCAEIPARGGTGFAVDPSGEQAGKLAFVSPDLATCDDCLRELFDPANRRHGYALLNCTQCGPRLTIIDRVPYDRRNTSLATFEMCAACQAEYDDPANRRYHAEPNACAVCGPQLAVLDAQGVRVPAGDPLALAAESLRAGKIVALKSLGGYHLACDARNPDAVARLRQRKHRDAKPLAVMVADLAMARECCAGSDQEAAQLVSAAAPIVLLKVRAGAVDERVAPRNRTLGVMLPYTPVHHWLFRTHGLGPLVMTSGNLSDEPIAYRDDEAIARLAGVADLIITHNRPIVTHSDDSVLRVIDGEPAFIRRSRGFAPAPVTLPIPCREPTLALGGQLKATFALASGNHAFLSQHIGDLQHVASLTAYQEAIEHLQKLLHIEPALVVHDLHPDYASTLYAQQRVPAERRLAVQHHHAHLASCLAEHRLNEPAIGVIFDGTGYGTDGTIWGGEFLVGDYLGFRRAAHLRPIALAGGEAAVRQPWRVALAALIDAGVDWLPDWPDVAPGALSTVRQMLARDVNSPRASSAGRLFDAVAALLKLRTEVRYEGQAASELEWLAERLEDEPPYPFTLAAGHQDNATSTTIEIDTRPLIRSLVADIRHERPTPIIARRFHATLAAMIVQVCESLRDTTGINAVALSGGVFMNTILLMAATSQLGGRGFRVYRQQQVPPNDGGLCLGQLAIAAARQNADNAPACS